MHTQCISKPTTLTKNRTEMDGKRNRFVRSKKCQTRRHALLAEANLHPLVCSLLLLPLFFSLVRSSVSLCLVSSVSLSISLTVLSGFSLTPTGQCINDSTERVTNLKKRTWSPRKHFPLTFVHSLVLLL